MPEDSGTPRVLTDHFGQVTSRHDYYPYGAEVVPNPDDEPHYKFTGHSRDTHGLTDYMLGRTCAFPLMRFMSVDPGRDGWNMYAYVGGNPVNAVDPSGTVGVALNEAAREAVLYIAGQDANRVSFAEDGTFSVNASEKQLSANAGLRVLSLIASSSKKIGLVVGDQVPIESGSKELSLRVPIQNLSTSPDLRPGGHFLPPDGFDGIVGVYSAMAETRLENVGTKTAPIVGDRPVSLEVIIFHELTENYFKTHGGLQYAPAHALAIGAERALRIERPEIERFAFGAGPFVTRVP